jgi:polar amino acid transport system substrate-binding protein
MRRRSALIVLYAIVCIACASSEKPDRVIRVGAVGFTLTPSIVARDILSEAYSRIGFRAEYLKFPPNRMVASLNSGEVDALLIAESSLSEECPGVIRVKTPIWIDDLVVFSKGQLPIQGWESLRRYRIGYISAMFIIEKHLATGYETFPVKDPAQLFRMLEAGRTDAVVTSRTLGELTIGDLALKDIAQTGRSLATVANYHFLSKGNEDVARRLSAVLAEMERSGRIAEITKATLTRLFPTDDE